MEIKTVFVLAFCSAFAFGIKYPVDDEIYKLRAKASYLEALKTALETNHCSVEVGKTKVRLSPEALLSEGLVMAVGDQFPGNYLAYHKAPKPEHLEGVIDMTFLKNGMGKGAKIVTARLVFDKVSGKPSTLLVIVNDPYQEPSSPEYWFYAKGAVKLPITPEGNIQSSGTGITEYSKVPFTTACN